LLSLKQENLVCHIHSTVEKPAAAPTSPTTETVPVSVTTSGSRRRKLWELESRAFCPVVGVCLPIPVLRRVVNKTFRGHNVDTDYALHSGAVGQCASRTPLAEGMQRELEQRYALAIRQAASCKTAEALTTWWTDASQKDLAGPLWATLTHPRCSTELECQVLAEVHMLQHQVGAAQRADMQRLQALTTQNADLTRELANMQQKTAQLANEGANRLKSLQDQVLQLRSEVIIRDTRLASVQQQLNSLEASIPDLACRTKQVQELALQAQHIQALERALLQAQQDNERNTKLLETQAIELKRLTQQTDSALTEASAASQKTVYLEDRSVLCVGGRPASVPQYRDIIESVGARFAHHDGGEEESLTKLDTTLAAADLVICQTGCISHNAYWRVKDHCKRTGKQCVFVENPGTASLKRALSELQQTDMA
jgi:hypothetical protein